MQCRVLGLAVIVLGFLGIPASLYAEDAAKYVTRAKAYMDQDDIDKRIADRDKALAECDKAITIDSKSADAYTTRGRAWLFKHDYDKAIADCDKAMSFDPRFAEAYNIRGWAWFDRGDYGKSLADCNQAIAINPKLANAFCNRANVWSYWKGDYEKAAADYKRALEIKRDDWNTLNNLGVLYWKMAMTQNAKAAAAEAASDFKTAKACREKCVALKEDAKTQWIHGVKINPKATDIHSNLGYAYSDANDLDSAERHLTEAVRLKPISPRPRNNLGRVLLRRSQQRELEAREAEAKGKTDPVEAAKAKQLKGEAKTKLDAAIEQFEKAVELDPALLEAHLNLGEVYLSLNDLDKAESHYKAILRLQSESIKDPEINANFSHACFGLARVAIARKDPDEATRNLQKAIELNPKNVAALQLLSSLRNPESRSAAKKSGNK